MRVRLRSSGEGGVRAEEEEEEIATAFEEEGATETGGGEWGWNGDAARECKSA